MKTHSITFSSSGPVAIIQKAGMKTKASQSFSLLGDSYAPQWSRSVWLTRNKTRHEGVHCSIQNLPHVCSSSNRSQWQSPWHPKHLLVRGQFKGHSTTPELSVVKCERALIEADTTWKGRQQQRSQRQPPTYTYLRAS